METHLIPVLKSLQGSERIEVCRVAFYYNICRDFSVLFMFVMLQSKLLGLLVVMLPAHEVVHDVHGHREDDGGVVLGRDAVQRLKVAELQREAFVA